MMNSVDANQFREASTHQSSLRGSGSLGGPLQNDNIAVNVMVSFKKMAIGTLLLPLCSMFTCFVTAYIFQPDDIHETHCRVYNIIPSISAITGISPQRYLWRVSIAVHVGPRFLVAFAYRCYYNHILAQVTSEATIKLSDAIKAKRLINTCFWLSITEISALLGVTYISNRENYPLHEKIFIVFMTSSLVYMILSIRLCHLLRPNGPITENEEASLKWKKVFFYISISSTIGLLIFFAKHRFLCHDMAFSWFALCEYLVASANMGFHCTTMLDFPTEYFLILKNAERLTNQLEQINSSSYEQIKKKSN